MLQKPLDDSSRHSIVTKHSIRASNGSLRILLAEDTPVNQALASRMLEKMGHAVVVAGNGVEALHALDQSSFDLILMDVQMPEMDGFDATRAIRERENGKMKHIPIIAMTAYAMAGDKERCLEAGMNGYIAKPINARDLFEAVESIQCGLHDQDKPLTAAPREPKPDKAQLLERVGGDADLLKEVVHIFVHEFPKTVARMKSAMRNRDFHSLERAAHAMKGSVGNFRATSAVDAASALEAMAKDQDIASVAQAINALEQELNPLQDTLLRICGEIGP